MFGSEKGSVLVIVIVGITIIAAIGAGVASLVTSGARTGVDHSLSVQAFYAAESGLEWAGSELRKDFKISEDWENTCADWSGKTLPPIGQASFTITGEVLPVGCKVTVTGSVGSLASRKITATISKEFIESSGGEGAKPPEDADEYGGEGIEIEGLNIGNHKTVSVKEGTTIDGNIAIGNHSEVYFYNDVTVTGTITLKPNSVAYFGDNFNIVGNIFIDGEACFGDNVIISGTITVKNNALLCIGDNLGYGSFSTFPNSKVCSKDGLSDYNYKCVDGYASECNELCPGEGVGQNPVGTEDGSWSEG